MTDIYGASPIKHRATKAEVESRRGLLFELPYGWLADSTRWQRKAASCRGPREAIERAARLYRKALWSEIDAYV
ncbi:MAG TPA: hypothetical protein VGF07_10000, partial [Stellaceae bacterium]